MLSGSSDFLVFYLVRLLADLFIEHKDNKFLLQISYGELISDGTKNLNISFK